MIPEPLAVLLLRAGRCRSSRLREILPQGSLGGAAARTDPHELPERPWWTYRTE